MVLVPSNGQGVDQITNAKRECYADVTANLQEEEKRCLEKSICAE
jgi:hypothetical protein